MLSRLGLDVGLLVLRVAAGGTMLAAHGWAKLSTYSERAATFGDPLGVGPELSLGLAIFAEFFCAAGVLFGVLTRLAAIPLMTTMAVAFLVVHGADPWVKKELAFIYFWVFAAIGLMGPGRLSGDHLWARRKRG